MSTYSYDLGRSWAERARALHRDARRPIAGTLLEERTKALRIRTKTRASVWLPKSLVTQSPEGVFTMPSWLAEKKLLD